MRKQKKFKNFQIFFFFFFLLIFIFAIQNIIELMKRLSNIAISAEEKEKESAEFQPHIIKKLKTEKYKSFIFIKISNF